MMTNQTARARAGRHAFLTLAIGACLVASVAQAQDFAESFGAHQKVTVPLPDAANDYSPVHIDVDSHRHVVYGLATTSTNLVGMLNKDGSAQTSFGTAGRITVSHTMVGMTVDNQDRIIVLESDGGAVVVERYLNDGSPDASFGICGAATIVQAGDSLAPLKMTVDAHGSIAVATTDTTAHGDRKCVIAKLKPNGQPVKAFGTNGLAAIDLTFAGINQLLATTLTFAESGNILVDGYSTDNPNDYVNVLTRILPNGALDSSFGYGTGFVTWDSDPGRTSAHFTYADSIFVDANGNYVIAGATGSWTQSQFAVARYTPNGDFDSAFNSGNPVIAQVASMQINQVFDVHADFSGRLLLSGLTQDAKWQNYNVAFRLNDDGSMAGLGGSPDFVKSPRTLWGGLSAVSGRHLFLGRTTPDKNSLIIEQISAD